MTRERILPRLAIVLSLIALVLSIAGCSPLVVPADPAPATTAPAPVRPTSEPTDSSLSPEEIERLAQRALAEVWADADQETQDTICEGVLTLPASDFIALYEEITADTEYKVSGAYAYGFYLSSCSIR